jgi:hypothetical protein
MCCQLLRVFAYYAPLFTAGVPTVGLTFAVAMLVEVQYFGL